MATLSKDQLAEIRKTKLAKVICTMMKAPGTNPDDVVDSNTFTKENPFLSGSANIKCDQLGGIDFLSWKEETDDFPDEVHICGEKNFQKYNGYNVTYVPKHADGKYSKKWDASAGKAYFEGESAPYFLWYDSDRYNWVVSRELFKSETG